MELRYNPLRRLPSLKTTQARCGQATPAKSSKLAGEEGAAMLYRSTILGQASGSLAGTTFSRNKGGQYTRARAIPTNPNSTAQQAVRAFFTAATTEWKTLSAAQRGNWDAYAASTPVTNALGDSTTLTGFQWYVATTVLRSRIAGVFGSITTAPTTPGLVDDAVSDVAISVATGATATLTQGTADLILLGVGPVLSAGVTNTKGPVSTMSEVSADPSGGAFALDRAGFPYGALVAGQRRLVEARLADSTNGKIGSTQRMIVTVTA